jgi:hypothetical protein
VDIFYPSVATVFSKEGVFQQPQALAQACAVCSPILTVNECNGDLSPVVERMSQWPSPQWPVINLVNVKSAVVSPETVTGLDWPFAPAFHAVTV